jgi:predicted membrane metal-binding protein
MSRTQGAITRPWRDPRYAVLFGTLVALVALLVFVAVDLPAIGVVACLVVILISLGAVVAKVRIQVLDMQSGTLEAEARVVELASIGRSPYAVFEVQDESEEGASTLELYLTPRAAERLEPGDAVSISYFPASRRVASIRWNE